MRRYFNNFVHTTIAGCLLFAFPTIASFRTATSQTYISIEHPFPELAYGITSWGDYDNDNDLDLLMTGYIHNDGAHISRIYQNDAGSFSDIGAGLVGFYNGSGQWGDYDNDGDLDIILFGWDISSVRRTIIYRNDGGGNFTDIGASLLGISQGTVCWGDYDNDGDLDILLEGGADYPVLDTTLIYRNDGNDTFSGTSIALPAADVGSLDWGDYDKDGDLDILLTGRNISGALTVICRNDGNDIFSEINPGFFNLYAGQGKWGDYDQDGDLDIIVDGSDSTATRFLTFVYRNDGGDVFTDINATIAGAGEGSSLVLGDSDNDGDLDVLVSSDTVSGTSVFIYESDSTFTHLNAGFQSGCCGSLAWGDYDNDGDLDVMANLAFSWTDFYRNDNPVANTPPEPPGGLQSNVDSNTVTLSWNAANDAETQSQGLSYNVRVGTTPDGVDILSPMANVATGYRKIVDKGNANQNLSWSIRNLTDGIYYWSVQSIDNGFAGSQFAAEATFAIGDIPYLCGDANGDEALNVGDAVFIVNFVFKGGATPVPIEAGDANCDGATNVGDAVYLINYAFNGGPEPCCP